MSIIISIVFLDAYSRDLEKNGTSGKNIRRRSVFLPAFHQSIRNSRQRICSTGYLLLSRCKNVGLHVCQFDEGIHLYHKL